MAGEDPEYVSWVHRLPCVVTDGQCRGSIDAHHAGERALSRRAHDRTCVPLCHGHHMEFHSASGYFARMRKDERREFARAAIEKTQAAFGTLPDWF